MSDSLKVLRTIDRLEVGPVRVEPRRLVTPYRVVRDGSEERTELIYTYEEDVFDPSRGEDLNLAAMIGAQAALNYGLFCDAIVFHGFLDAVDRRFLRSMAENTAREIYVKKFLEPNPFLRGEAARLPAEKRKQYLRARLEFPQSSSPRGKAPWTLWANDRKRHAVLSSGGKDSLLTYGLLEEVLRGTGGEVHPLFVNESGRHWFTALNAYRHFKEREAFTARVWVNSDRVFAWMLHRLPFIREDFARVRSDEYPVRLWTVAVFLFGVLPLLRKRGIGRLLVGDEYDTTVRAVHEGISHYDGLFDQSLPFDNVLSSYFLKKGWAISQFSILRPLSELLVQKVLLERYPRLQEHQVSCHAAHKEGERVHPCGKCEKCRRIVGMVTALDGDPSRCGYSPEQVKRCLEDLARKGVHQEAEGGRQLAFLLARKGVVEAGAWPAGAVEEHPEVMKLRFDPRCSPASAVPVDLRRPLLGVFLEHVQGAVKRRGRDWKEVDPLSLPDLFRPYPFEPGPLPLAEGVEEGEEKGGEENPLWGELNWPDAAERLEKTDIALLPVGALEQHGPHLPLDTDGFDAAYLARRVAEACTPPRPLVLPLVPYGVSYHHDRFKGTVSIGNETLARLVYDIGMSAARNGVRKLVVINGHGGNDPALNHAAQMINRDASIFVCVDTGETSDVDIAPLIETPNDVHAGETETSTSLAVRPHLVRMDRAEVSVPEFSSRYLDFTARRGVSWYVHTHRISSSGVMGDPTRATVEKGNKIWEIMIAHLVALVEELKEAALGESPPHEG